MFRRKSECVSHLPGYVQALALCSHSTQKGLDTRFAFLAVKSGQSLAATKLDKGTHALNFSSANAFWHHCG